jgi:hypothetical protein
VAITHADPPTRPPPGFTGQARVVAHLDGGVETVTVDVDDFSLGHINVQGEETASCRSDGQYLTDTCI